MTLQTLIPTLFGRVRAKSAVPSPAAPTHPTAREHASPHVDAAPPAYRLVILTLASQATAIDLQVRAALLKHRLPLGSANRADRSGGYLLELGYVLRCQRQQRAALVHLVSTLGETPGVRAIRWETAPTL